MTRIEKWRKNAMMSRPEMFRRMDIPVRTIEDWEAERKTPPAYVERLVVKELMEITQAEIESRMQKIVDKYKSDENGMRPVCSWAVIVEAVADEFVFLYSDMQEAIANVNTHGEGHVAYIPCNDTSEGLEPWYTDRTGECLPDHWTIEL